ncbi:hypothetical protein [Agromyces sp. CCNWLW203]
MARRTLTKESPVHTAAVPTPRRDTRAGSIGGCTTASGQGA